QMATLQMATLQTLPVSRDVTEDVVSSADLRPAASSIEPAADPLSSPPPNPPPLSASVVTETPQTLPTGDDTEVVVAAVEATSRQHLDLPPRGPATSPPSNPTPPPASIVAAPQQALPTSNETAKVVVSAADAASLKNSKTPAPKPVT